MMYTGTSDLISLYVKYAVICRIRLANESRLNAELLDSHLNGITIDYFFKHTVIYLNKNEIREKIVFLEKTAQFRTV